MLAIVMVVAIYAIYKITREIVGNTAHLTDEDILEYKYRRRSLSESYQRRITNHIGTCEACRKKFTDTLME